MNVLKFYTELSKVFEQESQAIMLTPGNQLSAFWVDISRFTSTLLSNIDITLKGSTDIDFKEIVGTGDLYTFNDILYYKGIQQITSQQGVYYFEITDGTNTIYSNPIFFDRGQTYVIEGDGQFVEFYVKAGTFSFYAAGTETIIVNWGSEQNEYTLPQLITKTLTETTIVEIYNPQNLTEITCNDSLLYKIENIGKANNLEILDYSDTSVERIILRDNFALTEVRLSDTPFNDNARYFLGNSPLEIIEANNIGSPIQIPLHYVTFHATLKELYASGNEYSSINPSTQGGQVFVNLEIIDLSNNEFTTIPKAGLDGTSLSSPVREWIVSGNDIRATDWNSISAFVSGVTEKIDLKNNAINSYNVERILKRIAEYNTNLEGLYVDVSGASPVSGIIQGAPTDGMFYYVIEQPGENYVVGDFLNVTDGDDSGTGSIWRVDEIDGSGGIVSLSVVDYGSGYNAIENFTGGSGTNGIIEFYSARTWLVAQGVELYTNAQYPVELLPENTLLDYQTKTYLKDEEDYLTWL